MEQFGLVLLKFLLVLVQPGWGRNLMLLGVATSTLRVREITRVRTKNN